MSLVHVPYRSNADAMPDLLAGNVQMMFESIVFPAAKAGKLDLVAVLGDQRYEQFPDVPTLAELGMPEFDITLWYVLYAPAGTPQMVIDRVNAEVASIIADPAFSKSMIDAGYRVKAMPPAELANYMNAQRSMYGKLVKELDIKLE